jgi:hypothetical protein
MKKIICMMLILAMVCGLCACASAPEVPERAECIGYIIIPHADGDEYADIYNWSTNNGIVYAYCMDGRFVASPQIILVLEP